MNNSTINETFPRSPCSLALPTAEERGLKTLAYGSTMLLSLLGNFLVVLVVYKNHRNMHTTVNYLIVNMAVSDLLQSSIAIPWKIYQLYYGPTRWLIGGQTGEIFCKCVPFLQDVSTAVSILSLVLIAFDRFLGVIFPMRASSISKRMHSVNMALTWVIAMAFHSPYFFAFRLAYRNNQTHCYYSWEPLPNPAKFAEVYFLATSTSLFFFPMVLLTILYSTILIRLTRRKTPGNSSFRTQQRIAKRNRNVLRMVFAVVVVFALCWLPINTFAYLSRIYVWTSKPCGATEFVFWALFVALSNASMTPYMYFLFSENYRQGLKRLFGGRVSSMPKSMLTRPRNLYEGADTSVSGSKRGMSLRTPQSTSLNDNHYNCIPRFPFR